MEQECVSEISTQNDSQCSFSNIDLSNANDKVLTIFNDTDANLVKVVSYNASNITFIPNSLFTEFPNVETLIIHPNQNLNLLLPYYFINANKLKKLIITNNSISELKAKVFEKAENLENINLANNVITSVNLFAFYKLSRLQNLNLAGNSIKDLNPSTFSWLQSLVFLDLHGVVCADKEFNITDKPLLLASNPGSPNVGINETIRPYNDQFNRFKVVEEALSGCYTTKTNSIAVKTGDHIVDFELSEINNKCVELQLMINEIHNNNKNQSILDVRLNNESDKNETSASVNNSTDFEEKLNKTLQEISELRIKIDKNTNKLIELNNSINELKNDDTPRNLMVVAIMLMVVLCCIGIFFVYNTVKKIMKADDICDDDFQRSPDDVKVQVDAFQEATDKTEEVDLNDKL